MIPMQDPGQGPDPTKKPSIFSVLRVMLFGTVIASVFAAYLVGRMHNPDNPAVVVERIVIYDTLPVRVDSLRRLYKLPSNYRLEYDTARKGWLAIWHWDDIDRDGYLSLDSYNEVWLFQTRPYAQAFPSPKAAVKAIRIHWAEVLKDRTSHQ